MTSFFINGLEISKDELHSLSRLEVGGIRLNYAPKRLYKYYPNTNTMCEKNHNRNYSIEALLNNTVYMQSPLLFDDPYDSTLFVDEKEFCEARLNHYMELCGFCYDHQWEYSRKVYEFSVYLHPYSSDLEKWKSVFNLQPREKTAVVNDIHWIFALSLWEALHQNAIAVDIWQQSFYKSLHQEYIDVHDYLVKAFRVSCFTTSPFSMLMWSHYANEHKGFCIEYNFPQPDGAFQDVFFNLFPVIYGEERTSTLMECLAEMSSEHTTESILWPIYKYGLLSKSSDWKYQNEWRLVSCDGVLITKDNYNYPFLPIERVYLGSKMSREDRIRIRQICDSKGIRVVCASVMQDKYAMQLCPARNINPDCIFDN